MIKNLFKNKLNNQHKYYINSNEFYNAYIIKDKYINGDSTIFVVLPNLYDAQKYFDYLTNLIGEEDVLFYPVDQVLTTFMSLGNHEFQSERLYTLNKLMSNDKFIVVTTLDGLLTRQLSKEKHLSNQITLKTNKEYDFNKLIKYLANSGYGKSYVVESPGTYAVRGGIIDIYLRNSLKPYRLDFFGNLLESIKVFDVETQRSTLSVETITLAPLYELFYSDEELEKALNKMDSYFNQVTPSSKEKERINLDYERLRERHNLNALNIYIPFFEDEAITVVDFSSNYETIFLNEYQMHINEKTKQDDLNTYTQTMAGSLFSNINYYVNYQKQLAKGNYFICNLNLSSYQNAQSLEVYSVDSYHKNLELLLYDLKNKYNDYQVLFNLDNKFNIEKLINFLEDKNYQNINFSKEFSLGSFNIKDEKIVVFDDEVIFGTKKTNKTNYRSILNQTTKISNVSELNIGDFVVHYDFGIGKYMGIKTMTLSNNKRDYLYIAYEGNEALYVPVDQISLVLKYSSSDGVIPKLTKIGSGSWAKTKSNVKKKIKDLSDRLVKLYALREQAQGYAFISDNEMQLEFENDFNYELTKDQQTSIDKIKKLMEMPKPMDVLLIGDVGFGKTEVALRAAFKAVLSGKQVLYLVPTTVLARQHYYTFKERFERFGASVKLMSRFVSSKNQKQTLIDLEKGLVDVVIGTHRLLSNDVKFNDLGLLIIDEEQRFGVIHKERIKELKINVDTLALSATPIPRTLQMSVMGLKDLALIETPPQNRYPVQTYIIPREEILIKDAIRREIARGGQIFYLYNRVSDIERVVLKLQKLVPEVKIAYAHGQMNKSKLESMIQAFIDHEFDLLVATTIIETGIDIPNTNTLIVHDADKLGLSQLYQIRGRVGRSDKIAYAYLMFEPNKSLTDEAYKRLKTLEEFSELGSGYKIALRDLAIRGAGDILGSEQSGFIDSVGYEMYMQLLDEVINNKDELKIEDDGEIYANRTVSEDYISEDSIRIEIHKQINKLETSKQLIDLKLELEDRFGKFSVELETYMYEKLFKRLAYKIGKSKVKQTNETFKITFDEETSRNINGEALFKASSNFSGEVKLSYLQKQVSITIDLKNEFRHWLLIACQFLEDYLNLS